jgi:two-component flavin-dependent monooxygenase
MPRQLSTRTDLRSSAAQAAEPSARYAAQADAERTLHPEVVAAITDAGFTRHFVPERWGGAAGTCIDFLHGVATVAEGCTSAAWCAAVLAGAARMGAYLPEAGQQELWAEGPDVKVVGALMPDGTAEPAPGGWRLTGAWDFTSGVDLSEWALVCALTPANDDREPWFFAVPRGDYRVVDTWFNVGMRGTASNTLILDDVFVPEHRGFARAQMLDGRCVGSAAPCHTAPLRLVSGLLFGAPALGAARAALTSWIRWKAQPRPAGRPGRNEADDRRTAAAAAGEIDAATLLMERAAQVADSHPDAARVSPARNPSDCALAVGRLVDVVERLFRTAGSRGQLESQPLQRIWRDVHCLSGHVALRFDTAAEAYGAHLLKPVESRSV